MRKITTRSPRIRLSTSITEPDTIVVAAHQIGISAYASEHGMNEIPSVDEVLAQLEPGPTPRPSA